MATAQGPTARFCEWACSTSYQDLPEEVRKETVTLLYDMVGGLIACSTLPTCLPVVELVKALGGRQECSIVGHPVKTSVLHAALANGTIGHGDEVDPTGQRGTGHFAAVTVPTALCVGQYVRASGPEFLRALAVGSEMAARTISILLHAVDHARRNFADTVGAAMGAAVTAGLLLGLDARQMEHALGLAACHACGLNSVYHDPTHDSKSLQRGAAAYGGTLAALLARRGFHGPPEVLTQEHGLFDAFAGAADLGEHVVEELGETYLMRQVAYKRFPVGGPNQPALWAFLQIMKKHKIRAQDIDCVEVSLSRGAFHTVTTLEHPSVHMPTVLSLAAVFGDVTFQHIHEERYSQDPHVGAFKERVTLLPQPGLATPGQRLDIQLRVLTRGGSVLTQETGYPLMDEEEVRQKFRALAGLRATQEKVLELEQKLKGIERVDNVAPLVSELELAS